MKPVYDLHNVAKLSVEADRNTDTTVIKYQIKTDRYTEAHLRLDTNGDSVWHAGRKGASLTHYENLLIQIYRKFYH